MGQPHAFSDCADAAASAAPAAAPQDESRDRFKLILNCIMIITSVIPPGTPSPSTLLGFT